MSKDTETEETPAVETPTTYKVIGNCKINGVSPGGRVTFPADTTTNVQALIDGRHIEEV